MMGAVVNPSRVRRVPALASFHQLSLRQHPQLARLLLFEYFIPGMKTAHP
jgi:hypothetical protein